MPSALFAALLLTGCDRVATVETRQAPKPAATENLLETVISTDETGAEIVPPAPAGQKFQALGTEPFWSIEVNGDTLFYSSPEQQTPVAIAAHLTAMGKHGDGGLRYVGAMEGRTVALTIRRGQCSDGMSDRVYPFNAEFEWGDRTLQGCARPK